MFRKVNSIKCFIWFNLIGVICLVKKDQLTSNIPAKLILKPTVKNGSANVKISFCKVKRLANNAYNNTTKYM
jgi:hypothetical protein